MQRPRGGRRERELGVATFPFQVGVIRLELRAAPDLDVLVAQAEDPDRLPFWAVIWPAAYVLAQDLVRRGPLRGRQVLELGCGAGLVGLAAAALGAEVLQTDRFPEAVALARRNARENGLPGVRQVAADWRQWPLAGQWPLVVASDVLYQSALHAPLLDTLAACVAPDGEVRLCDPDRPTAPDFLRQAADRGWTWELEVADSGERLAGCRVAEPPPTGFSLLVLRPLRRE
ncbi:MAG: methyltransferase domain-containing protein [Armatimonadetes bacterium]|nr:methyltransferase domain-containing protein [Armatimonadota bacterium]